MRLAEKRGAEPARRAGPGRGSQNRDGARRAVPKGGSRTMGTECPKCLEPWPNQMLKQAEVALVNWKAAQDRSGQDGNKRPPSPSTCFPAFQEGKR